MFKLFHIFFTFPSVKSEWLYRKKTILRRKTETCGSWGSLQPVRLRSSMKLTRYQKMVVFSTVSPCPMGVPIFLTGPCCKFLTFLFFAISNLNSLVLKELEREIESLHFIQMHFSRENIFLKIK